MPSGRIVITGMGLVTPLGHEVDSVWRRLLAGESGIGPVSRFPGGTFRTNFAGEVRGYDPAGFVDMAAHADAGLNTQFALGACAQAWRQAGLAGFDGFNQRRVGLYLGSGEGSLDYDNFVATNLAAWDETTRSVDHVAWARASLERMTAASETQQEPNAALAHLAAEFGVRGPAFNCMTACAASTQAIGEAGELIRHGDADVMIAGGSHSMIHPLGMTGFIRLTAMSTRCDDPRTAARPFDRTRDGFVMGEGAGIVILEDLEHALARGASPLVELVGYGSSADAFRITDMHPEGVGPMRAMAGALRQAGIDPRSQCNGRPSVHYISAHGTSTEENDKIESLAIRGVFGDLAKRIPVSSIKSMLGHLIAAAGGVELIACVLAIRDGMLPPTINYATTDPNCDLDYVPNEAREMSVEIAMNNSFGFGGHNAVVAIRKYRD